VKIVDQGKSEARMAVPPMRLFFALWPEASIQHALHAVALQIRRRCHGRVMRPDTLHLTLLFLGAVAQSRLPELDAAASHVHVQRFHLELDAVAGWSHNRIVYAYSTHPPHALERLADALREAVAGAGFCFDRKAFVPHVTLLRNVERFPYTSVPMAVNWPVQRFALVQSVAQAKGMRYDVVQSWPLL
jgi:2'-5' RNA ligase